VHPRRSTFILKSNFLGDLWEEIIEFSTLGPSERKLLKARRARAQESEEYSVESFKKAKTSTADNSNNGDTESNLNESVSSFDDLSIEAFNAAIAIASPAPDLDYDGYALRDVLLEKWGAPLDVDFQRQPNAVYCTVLPVAYGSRKCRHESELAYLMHLQGIIEILHRYDNLELFLTFIETTSKTPKVGTDSVPFRMELSNELLQKIL